MDQTWERPYTASTGRWLVIGWEAAALAMLAWTAIERFDLEGLGARLVIGAVTALWALGAYRILQMGAYVGEAGLRIRGLLRSRTLPWPDIAHVRLHRTGHKIGRWEIDNGMTVVVERRDGSTVNTELWAQGVDFHARPSVFRAVYHELRARHAAAYLMGDPDA